MAPDRVMSSFSSQNKPWGSDAGLAAGLGQASLYLAAKAVLAREVPSSSQKTPSPSVQGDEERGVTAQTKLRAGAGADLKSPWSSLAHQC